MSKRAICSCASPDACAGSTPRPPGKLFVSDGKFIYSYTPQDNRAEKMKLKETDDMRAPLAFLLGRLDFNKDFREFRAHAEDGGVFITAIPKSDKLPYSEVSFLVAPDFTIRRLEVKEPGQLRAAVRI